MGKYFGTDGIRGAYGDEMMNPEVAFRLGSALGLYLTQRKPGLPLNAVLGRDTRQSGPDLFDALTQGLNQRRVYVYDAGIVPTPAVAYAVVEHQADFGIAITASHNPAKDNGLKVFDGKGHKLSEESELELEHLIDSITGWSCDLPLPSAYPLDAAASYINYIRSLMHQNCLSGWKIVLDTANGATCETSPAAFWHWGAEVILIGNNPDGENINDGFGSEHPQALGEKVREVGANIGIAHDGDGDRMIVCDENGEVVDGEVILGLFGRFAMKSGALKANSLVTTVHSNLGLDHALREVGANVERVNVGDRNVASKMREMGSNIGGESSGHIIFSDFATTGDGLLAAVKLIDLVCKTGESLGELRKQVALFPQRTRNLMVAQKRPIEALGGLQSVIAQATENFGDSGRLLIRYSGTEPKIRLLVEGSDLALVEETMQNVETAVRAELEVIEG